MENEYQEIDLRELIRVVFRKWWIIAIFLVIGTVSTYLVTTYYMKPVYEAKTSLFIGKEKGDIGSISLGDLQLNSKLITDYREIAKSRLVADEVINNLNLKMDLKAFRSNLSISTVKDSRLFTINVQHTNPRLATDIANEIANTLVVKVSEIIEVKNVQVIDKALVPTSPVKPNKKLNIAIAGILGCMIGLFIIFLIEYFDNTFKAEEDVEKHLGLTVIGVIPKFKGEEQ
ncbi:YveK family protein [Vallitalea guaymasensis]|uniref:YveK family protein n=1 Tax=Vallitalea guaymasensis TaxID=1185412 RepID=UPI002729CDC2|nr:Wzz/FepE/Etk N-terminal domain-containing protein [Vallitalea guaymasensis]